MSRYVATATHRGATQLVSEFDEMLQSALAEYGPDEPMTEGVHLAAFFGAPRTVQATIREVDLLKHRV